MNNYIKDIKEEAIDFLIYNEDMVKDALNDNFDWDRNDINDLDRYFHEQITDREYHLEEAAFVLKHCENKETDSGLWHGLKPEQAIGCQAAYSFSNDVWFECEKLYNELKEKVEEVEAALYESSERTATITKDKVQELDEQILDWEVSEQCRSNAVEQVFNSFIEHKEAL